jgi:hypothetical protein
MPQSATIKSMPAAFRMMKAMQADGIERGEDYRRAAGAALRDLLEGRMAAGVDRHLAEMARREAADRRNGAYRRWLMTELGEIELCVPRTRTWSALAVVQAYARRAAHTVWLRRDLYGVKNFASNNRDNEISSRESRGWPCL